MKQLKPCFLVAISFYIGNHNKRTYRHFDALYLEPVVITDKKSYENYFFSIHKETLKIKSGFVRFVRVYR